jgi:hypothetical protein
MSRLKQKIKNADDIFNSLTTGGRWTVVFILTISIALFLAFIGDAVRNFEMSKFVLSSQQQKIQGDFSYFKTQWKVADERKNNFLKQGVEDKFKIYVKDLLSQPLPVNKWLCQVERVYSSQLIYCVYGSIRFDLNLMMPNPRATSQLTAGQYIYFSGKIVREKSFTSAGAIEIPELSVSDVVLHLD